MRTKYTTVWIQKFKDRAHLMLQWIDPGTGQRKSKSADTADPEKAELARDHLEYYLNCIRYDPKRVKALKLEVLAVEQNLDRIKKMFAPYTQEMPAVPAPCCLLSECNPKPRTSPIPSESGIYFFWHDAAVWYVGQSVCLRDRVTNLHNRGFKEAQVSWLLFPESELFWVECYYIWLTRPALNFGRQRTNAIPNGYQPTAPAAKRLVEPL
jgi:hypothetical protein